MDLYFIELLNQHSNVTPSHRALPAVFLFLCEAFSHCTISYTPLSAYPVIVRIS